MDDALADLALLAVLFVGSHMYLSHPGVRKFLIHRWTVGPFRIVHSTVSIILLIQMLAAYGAAPQVPLYEPAYPLAPVIAMAPAMILIFFGYTVPNLASVMTEHMVDENVIPGILKITRHPTMWGAALFSVSHMLANPHAANWILFGALTILALGGAWHLDRRKIAEADPAWMALCAQSSFVPFVAVLSGRARLSFGNIDWLRIGAGLALFVALLLSHQDLIGVAPLPPDLMSKIQM